MMRSHLRADTWPRACVQSRGNLHLWSFVVLHIQRVSLFSQSLCSRLWVTFPHRRLSHFLPVFCLSSQRGYPESGFFSKRQKTFCAHNQCKSSQRAKVRIAEVRKCKSSEASKYQGVKDKAWIASESDLLLPGFFQNFFIDFFAQSEILIPEFIKKRFDWRISFNWFANNEILISPIILNPAEKSWVLLDQSAW